MRSMETTKNILDRFYLLYEQGRNGYKAPCGYIDYFKARKFLMDEIQLSAIREREKILKKLNISPSVYEFISKSL